MISVIIATRNSAKVLPACLAALVPAAVSGLVREVIVADEGSTDATLAIADDAGARVAATVEAAAADAKGEWLLVLPPTVRLEPGWEAEAALHVDRRPGVAAAFRPAVEGQGLWARLREGLAEMGPPRPEHGLLVERERWGRPGPVRRLNARALPA
ncbi:glycosyltransferase [Caulobacter mirabilis]|uniref:Glycosyltransferase 2-like domain-containing protein n=1 Tax=Caulobacter mirabilis TaxID=69666 RepID=A0A2D2AZQ7_9CAUL|nr:glycosyltransferase [Caulobacter mirabilis]ATQ43493.1 hypothetical protein CSW64_14275 [Caulobacter mirabilis]